MVYNTAIKLLFVRVPEAVEDLLRSAKRVRLCIIVFTPSSITAAPLLHTLTPTHPSRIFISTPPQPHISTSLHPTAPHSYSPTSLHSHIRTPPFPHISAYTHTAPHAHSPKSLQPHIPALIQPLTHIPTPLQPYTVNKNTHSAHNTTHIELYIGNIFCKKNRSYNCYL